MPVEALRLSRSAGVAEVMIRVVIGVEAGRHCRLGVRLTAAEDGQQYKKAADDQADEIDGIHGRPPVWLFEGCARCGAGLRPHDTSGSDFASIEHGRKGRLAFAVLWCGKRRGKRERRVRGSEPICVGWSRWVSLWPH